MLVVTGVSRKLVLHVTGVSRGQCYVLQVSHEVRVSCDRCLTRSVLRVTGVS